MYQPYFPCTFNYCSPGMNSPYLQHLYPLFVFPAQFGTPQDLAGFQQTQPAVPDSGQPATGTKPPNVASHDLAKRSLPRQRTSLNQKNRQRIITNQQQQPDSSQKKPVKVWKNSLLSFICNKILKFIAGEGTSRAIVSKILENKNISESIIDSFYLYANKICSRLINRVSIHKISELWMGPRSTEGEPADANKEVLCYLIQLFHTIFRILSRYYLENIAVRYLVVSKKCKRSMLSNHLKMRKWLLEKLHFPGSFRCYKDLVV